MAVHTVTITPGRGLELTVLVLANVIGTVVRFLALPQLTSRRPV